MRISYMPFLSRLMLYCDGLLWGAIFVGTCLSLLLFAIVVFVRFRMMHCFTSLHFGTLVGVVFVSLGFCDCRFGVFCDGRLAACMSVLPFIGFVGEFITWGLVFVTMGLLGRLFGCVHVCTGVVGFVGEFIICPHLLVLFSGMVIFFCAFGRLLSFTCVLWLLAI